MTSEAGYPPAEEPADGDRTGQVPPPPGSPPRYSASASVPLPPPVPPVPPVAPPPPAMPAGGQYGQAWPPSGQPSQPQGTTGGQPPSGSARVGATASVPVPPSTGQYAPPPPPQPNPSPYGAPPQNYSPTSTLYGQSPGQAPMGTPPASGQYGAPPHAGQGQGGMGQGGMGQGGMGQGGMGGPPMAGPMGQPGAMGQGGNYPPPGYSMGQDPGRGGRAGEKMAPTGGWPYVEQPPPPPRKSRRWLLISLIVIAAVILIGGAGAIGYTLLARPSSYKVGACVKQQGDGAVVVDCGTSGAYQIVSLVDSEDRCPDPTQPSVELTGGGRARQVACLKPAAS